MMSWGITSMKNESKKDLICLAATTEIYGISFSPTKRDK